MTEWVSASEAVEALGAPAISGLRLAQHDLIYHHASEGLVRSRARLLVREAIQEDEIREEDAPIPNEFWLVDSHAGFKADWQAGRFVAKPFEHEPQIEWRALLVEFCKEDIAALGGVFDRAQRGTAEEERKRGKGGRKPDLLRWQSFYFGVIELAQNRELNASKFPSQSHLWREIAQQMGDLAFDQDYAEPIVSQIYKKFVRD